MPTKFKFDRDAHFMVGWIDVYAVYSHKSNDTPSSTILFVFMLREARPAVIVVQVLHWFQLWKCKSQGAVQVYWIVLDE